jgi:hypothetical protein
MSLNNLTNDSAKIEQPINLLIELKEHQKTSIQAMLDLEENNSITIKNLVQYTPHPANYIIETSVGILGDKVGSGKSLMIVGLLLSNKIPKKKDIYWGSSKYVSIKLENDNSNFVYSNLLIVPHKIISQWEKFIKYGKDLTHYICNNTESVDNLSKDDLQKYKIILVGCTLFESFDKKFNSIKWTRIIIDEADTIKLQRNMHLSANFIWLVTGTPAQIIYSNKGYLTDIFGQNKNWLVENLVIKNSEEFIKISQNLNNPKRIMINCLTPIELGIVKDLIPKNIINMINAGNTDEAIKILNCNIDTDDNIFQVITKNLSEAIKNKKTELDNEKKRKITQDNVNDHKKKILYLEKVSKRLEDRLESIKEKIYDLNSQYCPICLDDFVKPTLVNCCKNVFCFECLTLTIGKTSKCPNCRFVLGKQNMHLINSDDNKQKIEINKQHDKKDKLDMLIELIQSKPNGKFLVFANYTETFKKIELELIKNKYIYKTPKGSADVVNQYINDFKTGQIKILLLNAQYFGAGMNLQMATDIVMYHRFTKYMEEQIIGRANRIGREGDLNVHYLLHENEDNSFDETNDFDNLSYLDYLENIKDNNEDTMDISKGEEINDHKLENKEINPLIENNNVKIKRKPKSIVVKSTKTSHHRY